ncbi:precorrin-6y C5,15-methyltransferase (decarboxylating) subunit CbiE [Roseiflexus sp.]|uniref:precorrin-6y C5,15-methyltransferase (decarboxylating) subunit CbiE n=1 Tax=Roseiflexus sp. TaxID=2562120 RepID=UPI00398B3DB3
MTTRRPILVVGMTDAGEAGMPVALRDRIIGASLLVGGQRHLAAFPEFSGDRLFIGASVEPALERLKQAWEDGETAVVLASGDPLWYGIGATLRRVLPPEALEVVPAPTSAQLAFAALAEPWHDAALLSAHGRPLDAVIAGVLTAPKAAILTDQQHTPNRIATALIDAGLPPATHCAVCEHLGGPMQRVVRTTLHGATEQTWAALNVFVVWNDSYTGQSPVPPGLPDDVFSTEAGQITKREVRLLSLAELALQPGEVLWDIGAGSGSVAIEAARACPTARVYAVERRERFITHIRENLHRFPAPNLYIIHSEAPDACAGCPDPHAVFVGGSGGRMAEIVHLAQRRLNLQGRLVLNLVALQHVQQAVTLLPDARVIQAQINRGAPIQSMLRLEALNPVFLVVWRKEKRDD